MTYKASRPFGLYVHWPYCVSKCPYCDFNSHVASSIDHHQWAKAFENELKRVHQESSDRTISSIFFGGGTPSLMKPKTVETIIDTAQNLWGFTPDVEITLEANPTTVEIDTFHNFHQAGVNRLSVGIQSLRPDALKFLERAHNIEDALRALDLAAKTFERFSFDLIYARPGQTLKDWETELREALSYNTTHLSLYQLTIEPGTQFFKDKVPAAEEDLGADLFDLTQEVMEEAGLPAYEISNHARAGEESRHNLVYWQGDDYIGIGPGAHSRLNDQAIHQIYKPDLWLQDVSEKGSGEQKRKQLSASDRATELLLMGLRLRDGIETRHFKELSGFDLKEFVDPTGLDYLQDLNLIEWTETHLRTTKDGRTCLNGVLEKLIP
jgi:oxygen-independent coproporphyrinogen-3 oxidase